MEHVNAVDDLLARLHDALTSAGAGDEPVRGSSGDGLVTASVTGEGRVAGLEADPRVLRRPPAEIAQAVVEAVNDALDALAAAEAARPDLLSRLQEVQEDSERVMAQTRTDYDAALKRMEDLF